MKITRILSTLAAAALAAMSNISNAAPGDLDLTFGGTGKVTTVIGSYDEARSVAVQTDAKIVVAGYSFNGNNYDIAVVRYNANGSLDTSFNGTGKVTTSVGSGDDYGYSVAVQTDAKIVVAGYSFNGNNHDIAVVRYNANGSLDTSFNGTGKVTTAIGSGDDRARSVAVQPDGKIAVTGDSRIGSTDHIVVVRYNSNGTLDTGFGSTGKVTTDLGGGGDYGWSVAVQNNQKIVVAGDSLNGTDFDFALVRYNVDGSLDTSFGIEGKVTTAIGASHDSGRSLVLQNDAKIVVAGSSIIGGNNDFAVVRYTANGTLDTGFGSGGKVTTDLGGSYEEGRSVALQSDGKIVVAGDAIVGSTFDFAVVRYNANGTLDTTFGGGGIVTTAIGISADEGRSVTVQSNGGIVVAGYSSTGSNNNFAVVRFDGTSEADTDEDGIPDIYETGTGIYVSPTDTGTSPTNPDTDGDGLSDGREVNTYHSNPNIKDTDGDGFDDGFEVSTGFSPTSAASTPDAQSSIRTAAEYRFAAALGISYRIEASADLENWTTIETDITGAGGIITRFYSIEGQARRYFRSRRN